MTDQTVQQQRFYVDAFDAATPYVVFDRCIVEAGGIGDVAGPFATLEAAQSDADERNAGESA
jgi:hypothetical protein